jgi:hypothetical protein
MFFLLILLDEGSIRILIHIHIRTNNDGSGSTTLFYSVKYFFYICTRHRGQFLLTASHSFFNSGVVQENPAGLRQDAGGRASAQL